jgi:hypothetical protein
LQISRGGPISSWGVSDPQIVYTGSESETAGEPKGRAAMPGRDALGYTDLIFVDPYLTPDSPPVALLDVDYCVDLFTPSISNPDPEIPPDLWLDCLVAADPFTGVTFDIGDAGRASDWLSPNEILRYVRDNKGTHLYKTNIHTGISTKLVDKVQ